MGFIGFIGFMGFIGFRALQKEGDSIAQVPVKRLGSNTEYT